jgi:hypothetical protein
MSASPDSELNPSALGALLRSLPAEVANYILRMAVYPTPVVMTMRAALNEYRACWQTLATLRCMHKRTQRPNDGLNALFYEATLHLWTQTERVAFANDSSISEAEIRRIQERDDDTFRAIKGACGRDNAAWMRALSAYKARRAMRHETHPLTP